MTTQATSGSRSGAPSSSGMRGKASRQGPAAAGQFPARLLSVQECAKQIGCGAKAIRFAIRRGKLAAIQLNPPTSPYLISVEDLKAWLDSCRIKRRAI